MNKVYKLMWSSIHGAWVVCSELGKRTKSSGIKIILATAAGVGISSITFAAECVVGGSEGYSFAAQTAHKCSPYKATSTIRPSSSLWNGLRRRQGVRVLLADGSCSFLTPTR